RRDHAAASGVYGRGWRRYVAAAHSRRFSMHERRVLGSEITLLRAASTGEKTLRLRTYNYRID
ncbi:MAG: hypothetical protein ACK47M_25265, partial [Caldilinea sp.]